MPLREVDPGEAAVELLAEERRRIGLRRRELARAGRRRGRSTRCSSVVAGDSVTVMARTLPAGSVACPHPPRRPAGQLKTAPRRTASPAARCRSSGIAAPHPGDQRQRAGRRGAARSWPAGWSASARRSAAAASGRGGGRPTAAGRRPCASKRRRAPRRSSASPVNGSTKASSSSAAADEEVHRHPDADDGHAGPPADLDHHRGQQDRQAAARARTTSRNELRGSS